MTVEFPPLKELINDSFIDLWKKLSDMDIIILMGGRDSSKTNFVAKKLIIDCLASEYFRCILIRKSYSWVADSQWLTIKDEIEFLGLGSLFSFTKSPYKITCIENGNSFMCRGMDDPNSIKSVKDPSAFWVEEDIVYFDERDYIVVSQSLRSTRVKRVQQYITLNPEIQGEDYLDNWFVKKFYGDRADTDELTFDDSFKVELDDVIHEVNYTCHHSTYKDNRWCPPERQATHESLRLTNPHWYKIFTLGLFGNKSNDGLFYNTFDRGKHVLQAEYNPARSLHITWDFNVKPYVSLGVWQMYDDREQNPTLWDRVRYSQGEFTQLLVKVDEIAGKPPRNRTKYVCEDFLKEYRDHDEALFIYGDPAGKHEDTRSEKGSDDFNIILKELKEMNPRKRVMTSAPSITKRGEFICSIFAENAFNIAIAFDPCCKHSIIDYTSGQEDADGKKSKKKVKDPESGITYEKYHHFSDGDDYFITKLLNKQFKTFLRGGKAYNYDAVVDENRFQH